MPAEIDWDPAVWEEINAAVRAEVGKVRVAQKVFPTTVIGGAPTEVPDDVVKFPDFSIEEGRTKPFVEISQTFSLTAVQVAKEPILKTAKILARMAAKAIALAEDKLLFQGKDAALGTVTATGKDSLGTGLLGAASPNDASDADTYKVSIPIDVRQRSNRPPIWGENLFSAAAKGISNLTANKGQTPRYALILPLDAYTDTFVPLSNATLDTTSQGIRPLMDGGFHGTAALPAMTPPMGMAPGGPGKGLLVALGGDPTVLYVGREAEAEFVVKQGAKYNFRVAERVQFVARDPCAFGLLNFLQTP
jgi:uncharacterized linocin/CFP29 family protein